MLREVTVWLAWRDATLTAEQRERLVSALSDDELIRASRYHYPADADAFRWSRGVQRAILAAHVGVAPAELRFEQAGDDKPRLVAPAGVPCEYNASHSGDLFALAVSEGAVGVDIERARALPAMARMAQRVFDDALAAVIAAAQPADRDRLFFTAWTQLEAHAKLHGHGVWRMLAHREAHAAAEGVRVASFDAPLGYYGAVAVAGGEPRISVRWWHPEMRGPSAAT